jgi:hypothetical protein
LVAHGEYSSIANFADKILAIFWYIFVFFAVFQNNYVFVPQFLEENIMIFCVILGFLKTFLGNKWNSAINWWDYTAYVVD